MQVSVFAFKKKGLSAKVCAAGFSQSIQVVYPVTEHHPPPRNMQISEVCAAGVPQSIHGSLKLFQTLY